MTPLPLQIAATLISCLFFVKIVFPAGKRYLDNLQAKRLERVRTLTNIQVSALLVTMHTTKNVPSTFLFI
jgi:hypothetical protein